MTSCSAFASRPVSNLVFFWCFLASKISSKTDFSTSSATSCRTSESAGDRSHRRSAGLLVRFAKTISFERRDTVALLPRRQERSEITMALPSKTFRPALIATGALFGATTILGPQRQARADEVSPDAKGIVGGALLGAEIVTMTESIAGARPGWAYAIGSKYLAIESREAAQFVRQHGLSEFDPQFSVGSFSIWSITIRSSGSFFDSSLSPSCSCIAVCRLGAFSASFGASTAPGGADGCGMRRPPSAIPGPPAKNKA